MRISYTTRYSFLSLLTGCSSFFLPLHNYEARTNEREWASEWGRQAGLLDFMRTKKEKNRYSLWMGFVGTNDHEIFALMLFPTPHQRCWLDGVEAYCRGTIWQSSAQLELQCAFSFLCTLHFAYDHTEIFLNTFTAPSLWSWSSRRRLL